MYCYLEGQRDIVSRKKLGLTGTARWFRVAVGILTASPDPPSSVTAAMAQPSSHLCCTFCAFCFQPQALNRGCHSRRYEL